MRQELSSRFAEVKIIAMIEMRVKMGVVELVNWWNALVGKRNPANTFNDLDNSTQRLLLKWGDLLREQK